MKNVKSINGALIKNLYTKCFFVDKKLCYQIVINYEQDQVFFKNFNEYEAYRIQHNSMIEAINNDKIVNSDFQIMDPAKSTITLKSV